MEWKTVRLGDYISIKSGLAYKGSKLGHGDSILLGMGCVSFKDKFVMTGARPYNDVVNDRFCVAPGDIVLATRQHSDNLPILAMPAIIPPSFEGKRVIFGTNLYKVDNHSEISNRFLFWLLKHQHYVNYIAGVKSGTAVQMVTKKNVEDYKFLCPPKNEREKIADILWTYDSLIENNKKRIKLLEQMAENLYKEWFVRFRFPGYETAEFEGGVPKGWDSQASNNRKPKGWTYGELKELGAFVRGKNITSAEMVPGPVPIISAGIEPSGYHNQANVDGPSLTISSSGANAGFLKYNLTNIWAADCSYYNIPNNIWFVYFSLKYLRPVLRNLQCGAAQPHVYPKDVNRLCIILPPDDLIKTFERKCQMIFETIHCLNKQIGLLTTQRDLLLPRLMSGKLSI